MTASLDRRGEAHLWLVFEEALAAARAEGTVEKALDARLSFREVAHALAAVGAIDAPRADAIMRELDDALAVRGLTPPTAFTGMPFPEWREDEQPVRRRGDGWLEAQIEHHLDLIVDLDPLVGALVGPRMLGLLNGPVRALQSAGSLPHGAARLADVAATLHAAGYDVPVPATGDADKGWLAFLRDRPAPLTEAMAPVTTITTHTELGTVRGQPVVVRRLGWSDRLLEVEVATPYADDITVANWAIRDAWRCSVFDDAGRLHLGQPAALHHGGEWLVLVFRLRPGLIAGVSSMSVRVTYGAERLEERVRL